jgi:nucleotide-binding universal stress UspA family protein
MFKKILIPLDGTENAEQIGGWAVGLAQAIGADVELLAVVDPNEIELPESTPYTVDTTPGHKPLQDRPGYETETMAAAGMSNVEMSAGMGHGSPVSRSAGYGTQIVDQAVEYAQRYLQRESERVNVSGVKVTTHVEVGDPADVIVEQAKKLGADMIAIATHRGSALARGILGSVTDRVLHSASVPVLTVHPQGLTSFRGNAGAPNAIIVALDGSERAEEAVPVALEIAQACGSEIVFLQSVRFPYYGVAGPGVEYYGGDYGIAEQRREVLDGLSRFVKQAVDRGVKARAHAAIGTPAARIIEEAENNEGALVVMTTRGASGIRRWVLGSVTDKVVRSAGRPVLVLRSKS